MLPINNAIIEYLNENHHGWTTFYIESSNCVCIHQIGSDPLMSNTEDWIAIDLTKRTMYIGGYSEVFNYDNIFQVITCLLGRRASIMSDESSARCIIDE